MPVPKRKRSKSRRDKRFANKGIQAKAFTVCSNCVEIVSPHQVCYACGYYRGRKVITTKSDRAESRTITKNMTVASKNQNSNAYDVNIDEQNSSN